MFCKFDDTEFIVVFNLFFLKVEHVAILDSFVSMRIKYGKQMGKQCKRWETIFLGSKITADGDCSHEIPRCLLLGRKIMTNLDSILKSRDITLPTKVQWVKAVVFPVVMYGCESGTIKKAERQRTDAFDSCESLGLKKDQTSQSSRKSVLNIHWKDWCWNGNSNTLTIWCEELAHLKRPWCWERLKAGEGATEDGMVGWHHQLNGHEFEQALGVGDGQGSLACCSPRGYQESDATEQLNWTKVNLKTGEPWLSKDYTPKPVL